MMAEDTLRGRGPRSSSYLLSSGPLERKTDRAMVRSIGYGVSGDFELNFGLYCPVLGRDDADTDTRPD
jgi:hypothetical protein